MGQKGQSFSRTHTIEDISLSTNYNAFNKTVLPISTLHIISRSTQLYIQQKILLMYDVKTFRDYVPYFKSIDP